MAEGDSKEYNDFYGPQEERNRKKQENRNSSQSGKGNQGCAVIIFTLVSGATFGLLAFLVTT